MVQIEGRKLDVVKSIYANIRKYFQQFKMTVQFFYSYQYKGFRLILWRRMYFEGYNMRRGVLFEIDVLEEFKTELFSLKIILSIVSAVGLIK